MKKLIIILFLTFLTSCNYQSESQKEPLLLTTENTKADHNINAILLYIDLFDEDQEIDYNIFDPKSDNYIGTNNYIISSNAGFGVSNNILWLSPEKNNQSYYVNGFYNNLNKTIVGLDIDVYKNLKDDLINDVYELVENVYLKDYLNPAKKLVDR